MTAEILREAAKVLREHAEKAQHTEPWCPNYVRGAIRHVERNVDSDAFVDCRDHGDDGWCGRFDMYDGEYVALMHPPVALALAAALEAGAEAEDEMDEFDDLNEDSASLVVRGAVIKLARAILRRSE